MADKRYNKMWILPEKYLFHDENILKTYQGRPAGSTHKLCNLDSNLNHDIHIMVKQLVNQTASLHCLMSKRIILNTDGVAESIKRIVRAEGCIVADLNNRSGKMRMVLEKKSFSWEGAQKQKQGKKFCGKKSKKHGDMVKRSQDVKLEVSKHIFNGVKPEGAARTAKQGNKKSAASWQIILQHQKQLAEEYLKKQNTRILGKNKKGYS